MRGFAFEQGSLNNIMQVIPKVNIGKEDMFIKGYEKDAYAENGIDFVPAEEYRIVEGKAVFKGIHFQNFKPQKRLITVLSGAAYITAVDLNKGSPQLGEYETFLLNGKEPRLVFVPEWYGVATISLEDNTVISVMDSGQYYGHLSGGIRYDDATLGIQWPVQDFQVSEKDRHLMTFKEYLATAEPRAGL